MFFRRSLLLVAVATGLLLAACKKGDSKEEVIDFGPSPGFQYRTPTNVPQGGDPTDWVSDGAWNAREKQLFAALNLSLDGPQQSGTWASSVYPNQSEATVGFTFTTSINRNRPAPAGARLAFVIVDRRYTELRRGEGAADHDLNLSFAPGALAAGALYRMYYVCYVPGQQVYFRSHGDIKVE